MEKTLIYITTLLSLLLINSSFADTPPPTTPTPAAPSACTTLVQEIINYTKSLPASTQPIPQPWQSITWLQTKLGPGKPIAFDQTQAIWNNFKYTLVAQDGAIVEARGQKPQELANYNGNPTIGEATLALGEPDVLETNNIVQYTWTCETGSQLSMVSNESQNQKIMSYKGTFCPDKMPKSSCIVFESGKLA